MEDLNEILVSCEKDGGVARPQVCMDHFKSALEDCGMHDLVFTDDIYTWWNHHHDNNKYVRQRLDRAVAMESWCQRFLGYKVFNEEPRHSDHRPVVLHTVDEQGGVWKERRASSFQFEARWLEEEQCDSVIDNAWARGGARVEQKLADRLKQVASDLQDWSKTDLGNLEKRISRTKKEVEKCLRESISTKQVRKEQILQYKT